MPKIDKSVPAGLRIFDQIADTITDAPEALKRSTGDEPPSSICRQLTATMNYASQLTAEVHDGFDAAYRPNARAHDNQRGSRCSSAGPSRRRFPR